MSIFYVNYANIKNPRKKYFYRACKEQNKQIAIIEKIPINGGTTELAIAKLNFST